MLGRTDSRARLIVLLVALCVAAGSLMVRLGQWQLLDGEVLSAKAKAQTSLRQTLPARRGSIYDRSGTVLLATTVDRFMIAAAPDQMDPTRRSEVGSLLARILGLDSEVTTTLMARITADKPYVVLARDIDENTADLVRRALAEGQLEQLTLDAEPLREYPQTGGDPTTTLASHLLGFVNREGIGQYGVEQYYQDVLSGKPKIIVSQRDTNNQPIPGTQSIVDPGVPGSDVRLTVDAGLQLALEQELLATYLADAAESVSAVVMDPYTGEVLAEASAPGYDANDYRTVAQDDPGLFLDPTISKIYEPGSVFKMLTAVAALGRDRVGLKTLIDDSGTLKLDGGRTKVSDADGHDRGWMTFQDIVAFSRNVGAARVALKLGGSLAASSRDLHQTWQQFGFGKPTGVDLAGEVGGLVRDPATTPWRQIDLANGSFGQGVAVTPMQLATAYAAMMNGGRLVEPHVVAAVGDQAISPPDQRDGLVTPKLSNDLIGLMQHVVTTVPFYRDRTLVPGYVVGGKTGTAQIWDPTLNGGRGAWKWNKFNYSFVGYIGRTEPELVIAVRIEEAHPSIARKGQIELPVMSFELFRRIATNAMTLLDLPDPPPPVYVPGKDDSLTGDASPAPSASTP